MSGPLVNDDLDSGVKERYPEIGAEAGSGTPVVETSIWRSALPDALNGGWTPSASSEALDLEYDLVLLDHSVQPISALTIRFQQRSHDQSTVRIDGRDQSGTVLVAMLVETEPVSMELIVSFDLHREPAQPSELLGVVQFFELMKRASKWGVWSNRHQTWAAEPIPLPDERSELSSTLTATIRALARIQRMADASFTLPSKFDEQIARKIRRANALLSGNTLQGTWSKVSISGTPALVDEISNQLEGGQPVEFEIEEFFQINGDSFPLGWAHYTLNQARIASGTSIDVANPTESVTLVPVDDNQLSVRLVSDDDATADTIKRPSMLNTLLDTYAGRWIAQDGTRILFDANTPQDVIAELRRRGEVATVWQVPSSSQEAEATVLIGH